MSKSDPRQTMSLLVAQREALEIEADALHSELTSPTPSGGAPPGVKGSFVDAEGYPRGDIDIVGVKEKRQRLACINTDHKALMKRIEQALRDVHAQHDAEHGPLGARPPPGPSPGGGAGGEAAASVLSGLAGALDKGLALIDEVTVGSPAADGGMQCGDIVMSFGPVSNKMSAEPLSLIPKVVQENMNRPVSVRVTRGAGAGAQVVELQITPAVWSGRGVLGCHLTPL
jgi:26S proteasome non-ATPase regulatory subunit 9